MKNRLATFLNAKRSRRSAGERCRDGFSMIEMLVVIIIILILSGTVYRISSYVTQRAGRARTVYELELLHNILEEYYALYGQYPPTEGVAYVDYQNKLGVNRYPGRWGDYEADESIGPNMPHRTGKGSHGLMYYIKLRYDYGNLVSQEEKDAYRERWAHYFDELDNKTDLLHASWDTTGIGEEGGGLAYSNFWGGLRDPYGNDWVYEGIGPDYQSYVLYSSGPGGDDPIGKDRWSE